MNFPKDLIQAYDYQESQTPVCQSPAEKVLLWAQELPHSAERIASEADRVEKLLEGVTDSLEGPGAHITVQLIEVLESYLEGVYGLLEHNEEPNDDVLEESLALLVQSSNWLSQLEDEIEEVREVAPLIA
jgi:hypothetical protein